jgi:small subunit ribosomal protein S8e
MIMAFWRKRSTRKSTGALLHSSSKKVRMNRGSEFSEPKVGQVKTKSYRRRGGLNTSTLLSCDKANVLDPKTGKTKVSKILLVSDNPSNPHYTRKNILTGGAIIKTEAGMAKVTNRPSREGMVNAVLQAK